MKKCVVAEIRPRLTKICSKCGEEKLLENFYKDSYTKDGYRPSCKPCKDKDQKKSFCPLKEKTRRKAYYSRTKDRQLEYSKKWYQENKNRRVKTKHKWEKENKHLRKAIKSRYRAQLLLALPNWLTDEQHDQIAEVYRKATELTKSTGVMHHVDHIVPLQGKNVCGLHVPWNLQVIPATENHRKHAKFDGGWENL